MTHPFELEFEVVLAATPDEVWQAIATGPGIDSWFMGRNHVEPREGGTAWMDTAGQRSDATVTAYEPVAPPVRPGHRRSVECLAAVADRAPRLTSQTEEPSCAR